MRRRLLVAAVLLTALVALLDLSGLVGLTPVRQGAAVVLGPLERALGPGGDPSPEEVAGLRDAVASAAGGDVAAGAAAVLAAPGLEGVRVVLARVVAVGRSGPAGPERVTLDVGARDGVEVDRTVVAAEGLVGRVVAVAPWTSDVVLLGGPDVPVGVRVGEAGVLGQAAGSAVPGAPAPAPGTLSLGLVERGRVAVGEQVRTLGSVGGRPFVPGVVVGTVASVDDTAGRLAPTGLVSPAVDPTTLDVVGVVLGGERSTPRPAVTGGG